MKAYVVIETRYIEYEGMVYRDNIAVFDSWQGAYQYIEWSDRYRGYVYDEEDNEYSISDKNSLLIVEVEEWRLEK